MFREGFTREGILKRETAACPLIEDNIVIEVPADQTQFTQRYTRETIRFITQNKDKSFFVYLAHNMPHIPLHASEKFVGSSRRGIYGDTIQELDWSTGEILKAVKDLGLDKNTLVIFTSDNGPNTGKGGSAGVLKGGKGSTLEGGVRVPFVARWPGTIPAGTESDEAITGMDLLPTLTKLAGGEVPDDRVIDGKDIGSLLAGKPDAKSPHEAIYYLRGRGVDGIRVGDWKYRMATDKAPKVKKSKKQPAAESQSKKVSVETLYNLSDDIGENTNLIDEHPEIARRLKRKLATFETELRKNLRPAGVASER
ncbi:arylsulfatase A [Rhodopirellula baltica WH47]|uniref:Arylsulfatase A n=1 Tax=Rhodopirellula baltica WH47 TaxID=991778 RepID=F2ALT2_RHOBT|nr:arylsulfatase A [Rhodopirellula baltica WH47]